MRLILIFVDCDLCEKVALRGSRQIDDYHCLFVVPYKHYQHWNILCYEREKNDLVK